MRPLAFVCLGFAILSTSFAADAPQPTAEQLEFFEKKIRPVLVTNCYRCHSAEARVAQSGLRLDTREAIRQGGQMGPAVVPGDVAASVLVKAIRREGPSMPPNGQLPAEVVTDLVKWIEMGAPDPRESEKLVPTTRNIDISKGRRFWAFRAPAKPDIPPPSKWARTEIDRFLAVKMTEKKLVPVADADRRTLARRAYYDLTGLPPTPEQVETFVSDKDSKAFEKLVDKLLASQQFGERWGRHWLDISRYAESNGRTRNFVFPYAWRYRDYVIASFNQDKPYDQFLKEQIAGDLLPYKDDGQRKLQMVATGFLAVGSHDLNDVDPLNYQMDVTDEMINVTTRAIMGLTVGCARCHDHKFDPIPTKDYYALAGIFKSTQLLTGLQRRPRANLNYFQPDLLMSLPGEDSSSRMTGEQEAKRAELLKKKEEMETAFFRAQKRQNQERVIALRRQMQMIVNELGELPVPSSFAMGATEAKNVANCKINVRGDAHKLAEEVDRGFIQVMTAEGVDPPKIEKNESGRLQLAEWLTNRDNPLTARVMVNRMWHHLFGRGLVRTVDNFGLMGERPSHPELLDHLAIRFMASGWSVKKMVREMILSRAYQLSFVHHTGNYEIDPDNVQVWRMNRRRLEAEAIRDSMLLVAGQLDLKAPKGSPAQDLPRGNVLGRRQAKPDAYAVEMRSRSVYVPVLRGFVPSMFEVFDFPEPSETKGKRDITTVAPQSLFLLNNEWVIEQTRIAADKLLANDYAEGRRVQTIYQQVLGRAPTAQEAAQAHEYVKNSRKPDDAKSEREAWARLYQALFASAEFLNRT